MKYIGVIMIFVGLLIQWNERRKSNAHVRLTHSLMGHIEKLGTGGESTTTLPDSKDKVPGSDMSFTDAQAVMNGGADKGAIGTTEGQLREVIDSFEKAEDEQKYLYAAFYALVVVGTVITVLSH